MSNLIDLASNFNRLGLPGKLQDYVESIQQEAISSYAGDSMGKLEMLKIASFFGVKGGEVMLTDGATEGIALVFEYLKPQTVYTLKPTFWEYSFFAQKHGSNLVEITDDGEIIDALEKALDEGPSGLVVLCNPNNPTGRRFKPGVIVQLAKKYPTFTFLVDETYLWFSGNYSTNTYARETARTENILTVTSLSKILSIPGLRIGFLMGSQLHVSELSRRKVPYSVLPLQFYVAEYALLNCAKFFSDSVQAAKSDRNAITHFLDKYANTFTYIKPTANFVFIKAVRSGLAKYLLEKDIRVRDGAEFGEMYASYIRMRLCLPDSSEGKQVLNALSSFATTVDTGMDIG